MSTTSTARRSLRARLRYSFDNSMSAGPVALIGWLAVMSTVVILVAGVIVILVGLGPGGGDPFAFTEATWQSLMRAMDAGAVAGDEGWGLRGLMLVVTIAGIFILSTLIGVLTTGIEARLDELRKGRSVVVESGHTLILGWSEKVFTILSELAVANANVRKPRIVILADEDKVAMEDAIRAQLGDRLGRTKVICRSGSPLSLVDLAIANPAEAKAIIVLAPEEEHADRTVLRALLALTNGPHRPEGANHIVATLREQRNLEVARLIAPGDARLVNVGDLIARVTAQTCRQSGLSVVYTELLDFEGAEIYFQREDALVGRTYGDALLAYEDSAIIGLRQADGTVLVNPPMDTPIATGNDVIAISEDDDTIRVATTPVAEPDPAAIVERSSAAAIPEHTLVLGWNSRGVAVISQLDAYVVTGSRVDVVVDHNGVREHLDVLRPALRNLVVQDQRADTTDRAALEALDLGDYDHVILLADDTVEREEADTRTLVTLLHLRDLAAQRGHRYSIVTEVLDSRNRELARVTSADDFIVSDELVSLLIAQIAEHEALAAVLTGLFDADGSEVYLRPAADYVVTDTAITFSTVVESARRRGETAIGYRSAADAADAERQYGVVVNPPKSSRRAFTADDRVIVLAES